MSIKLSIITINYNNYSGLQKTMKSVFEQIWKDFEYIIIDGGSNDGSNEHIESNSNKLSYWVSEKDKGIYNAMNKGILKSTGEFLLFLNSGDYFVNSNSLFKFIKKVDSKFDIIYGDWYQIFSSGQIYESIYPDDLTFYFLAFQSGLPHQSTFIKRQLFLEYGLYDENLVITADWKFFLNLIFKIQVPYIHINQKLVFYNLEGVSSKPEFINLQNKEKEQILKSDFPNYLKIRDLIKKREAINFYYSSSRLINVLKKLKILKNI